jgi:hypothetical protein
MWASVEHIPLKRFRKCKIVTKVAHVSVFIFFFSHFLLPITACTAVPASGQPPVCHCLPTFHASPYALGLHLPPAFAVASTHLPIRVAPTAERGAHPDLQLCPLELSTASSATSPSQPSPPPPRRHALNCALYQCHSVVGVLLTFNLLVV